MAGNKYLSIDSTGQPLEVASSDSSAGAGDAGKIVSLNSSGFIDSTMLNGVGVDTVTATASEAISAGDLVNIYNVSGTLTVRKADATAASRGKPCNGYAPAAISNSATGTVNLSGIATGYSSLTPGAEQFLGTAGARTETPNATSGQTCQSVGYALSATTFKFQRGIAYVRA